MSVAHLSYVQKFSSYRTENKVHVHYEDQVLALAAYCHSHTKHKRCLRPN